MVKADLIHRLTGFDLLRAPGHLLRRNHQRSFEIFARNVGDDVTRQQMALLIALAQHRNMSQRELGDATGIDKSTLKEMLARMVARNWVFRERDPHDSRAWQLQITDSGLELLAERFQAIDRAQREILAPLNDAEREVFIRCLRVLLAIDAGPPAPTA